MRLKNKLFLPTAALFIFLSIALFIFFLLLFRNDLNEAKSQIKNLFLNQNRIERDQEMLFFREKIKEEKINLDALFSLATEDQFQENRIFSKLTSLLASHPDLSLAQYSKGKDSYSVMPDAITYYSVTTFAMNDAFFFVLLPDLNEGENLFVAFPTPSLRKTPLPTYLLLSWKEIESEMKQYLSVLKHQDFKSSKEKTGEDVELEKRILLTELAPFYENGVEILEGKGKKTPSGIAFLSHDGKGKAILSKQSFCRTSFFNEKSLFENDKSYQLSDTMFLFSPTPHEIFIGNSLKLPSSYLTLGFSLANLSRSLALVSHQFVLIKSDDNLIAFSPKGERLSHDSAAQFFAKITKDGDISQMTLTANSNAKLYLMPDAHEDDIFFAAMDLLDKKLTRDISLQLGALILILLGISLYILNKLSKVMTEPVVKLVAVSRAVKEGELKNLDFPKETRDEFGQLTSAFKEMVEGLREKEKIRSLLNKVVSKDIAEEILKSDIHLGGEDRIVTILFADIRNFTEITATLPPQKTVSILNEVMTKLSKHIEGEGGVVDKFVGDEIMAIYGTPIFHPNHALRALSSARLMIEELRKWNNDRAHLKEATIEIGIGINTGLVVAGNMGAESRLNYTVVGPSVNLASRLCKAAGPMQIIVSEFTLEEPEVKDSFYVESLPPVSLKGFRDPVNIYQVAGFKWNM